jgi:hypothetical protein
MGLFGSTVCTTSVSDAAQLQQTACDGCLELWAPIFNETPCALSGRIKRTQLYFFVIWCSQNSNLFGMEQQFAHKYFAVMSCIPETLGNSYHYI